MKDNLDQEPLNAPPTAESRPLLPTTVVGSYSVPEWLERFKTERYQRKISEKSLDELHDMAIKAALKDQEFAGVDVISDGELRRDNDVDYLLARISGVDLPRSAKSDYYDYYDAIVTHAIPEDESTSLGLVDEFLFTRRFTSHPIKFSFTGPFSISRRVTNEGYADSAELVRAFARALNREATALVAAGADFIQIDEPFLAGYPEDIDLAVEAVNIVTSGVNAHWALHICYGNRRARPSWEGHYDFLFPAVLQANVDQLVLEFARKGPEDLALLSRFGWDREVGLGAIDVKSNVIEQPAAVASRIRRALGVVAPERLFVNPDCGLRNLGTSVAFAKLESMAAGARIVRAELMG